MWARFSSILSTHEIVVPSQLADRHDGNGSARTGNGRIRASGKEKAQFLRQ